MKRLYLATVAISFLAMPLQAQETYTSHGYGFTDIEPDTQVIPLAGGDTLYLSRYYFHDIPDSPDRTPGLLYCQGSRITRDGDHLFASGTCTRRDVDGDLHQTAWDWPAGDNETANGTFRTVFGTGSFASLECEGEWQSTDAFADLSSRWINTSTTTCTSK